MVENWNRIIFEIVQAQPIALEIGFAAARIGVNLTRTPRVYYGSFSEEEFPILQVNNAALELCGVFDPTIPGGVDTNFAGNFDILNFAFYQGAQTAFETTRILFYFVLFFS